MAKVCNNSSILFEIFYLILLNTHERSFAFLIKFEPQRIVGLSRIVSHS